MTTIVCDRYQMSGDSRLTGDDCTRATVRKVFRVRGVGVVGVAGTYDECMAVVAGLKSIQHRAPTDAIYWSRSYDVSLLILAASGIWCAEGRRPYRVNDKFCAIGSGAQAALAAMHCGKTTAEAVRIAARIDPGTGGRAITLKLKA